MQIDRPGGFENPVNLNNSQGHIHQIGEHRASRQAAVQRIDEINQRGITHILQFVKGRLRRFVRMKPVGLEKHIVVKVRIKRRIEINDIHRCVGNLLPHYRKIVAIEKAVIHSLSRYLPLKRR